MDFKVAPEIVNVLKDRVDQEIFGYTHVPDSYYEAAVNWWERSAYSGISHHFCFVNTNGTAYFYFANLSYGFAPCLCL